MLLICARFPWALSRIEAERLTQASTHWLLHTHGSHSMTAGTPLDIVQQNMGHASIDTTTINVTSEDRRRMKAMQQFLGRSGIELFLRRPRYKTNKPSPVKRR